jgi:hypothetical protein
VQEIAVLLILDDLCLIARHYTRANNWIQLHYIRTAREQVSYRGSAAEIPIILGDEAWAFFRSSGYRYV